MHPYFLYYLFPKVSLPQISLWIKRIFVNLANRNEKVCLTIDGQGINSNGPGRFRTQTDNAENQTCYFNIEINDKHFNTFLSKRIKNSKLKETDIYFQIEPVQTRSEETETFDAPV